jgi:transcriptional regulator with XRE-family HTH domain
MMATQKNNRAQQGRLSLPEVEALKNQGFNQSEIADMYGVTKQYVSWIKHRYGGRLTPREEALMHFPFDVPELQTQSTYYKRLRDHGEFVATGGVGMSFDKLRRLRGFYKRLREGNLVVEFDPSFPPEPGVSKVGGFKLKPRTAEDKDFLIRVNEHTELTEEGQMIWRFPPFEP